MAQARERLAKLAIALLAAFLVRVAGGDIAGETAWQFARVALLVQVTGVTALTLATLRSISQLPEGAARQAALKTLRHAGRSRVLATVLVAAAHARGRAPPALLTGASALAIVRVAIHPLTKTFVFGSEVQVEGHANMNKETADVSNEKKAK